jgi:hypothetical protein
MATLDIIGTSSPTTARVTKSWDYFNGEVTETVIRGTRAAVATAYETYKAVAGFSPEYDSVSFDPGRGLAQLSIRQIQDGAPLYELQANELSNPIWLHSHFSALSAADILEVRMAFESGTEISTGDAKQDLWEMLCKGTEEYLISSYVLRETKNVSKRSTVAASYSNVNRVEAPPDITAVNALIGGLPSGEWLKKAPVVRQVGSRRWQIVTEWWWAEKWSEILYGGTLTP